MLDVATAETPDPLHRRMLGGEIRRAALHQAGEDIVPYVAEEIAFAPEERIERGRRTAAFLRGAAHRDRVGRLRVEEPPCRRHDGGADLAGALRAARRTADAAAPPGRATGPFGTP